MKRYWTFAVLIPLIVLGMGIYYVEASVMKPDYYLKTLEGSAQAASSVQLQAQYGPERLYIDTNGSHDQDGQSFWASLNSNYYPTTEFKNLAKQYPQFMRGKRNANGLYVDDNVLGYANISSPNNVGKPDFRLDVSIYDKKQKESSSFTARVPKNPDSSVYLYKVNISGQTMELFAMNSGGAFRPAVHLYTVDMSKKYLVSDQTLVSAGSLSSQSDIIEPLFSVLTPSDYAVFQVNHFNNEVGSAHSGPQSTQLYVYDIQRGKLSTIDNSTLDNVFNNGPGGLVLNQQVGNQLYLVTQTNPGAPLLVAQYDLAATKVRSQFTIDPQDLGSNDDMVNSSRIINHQLYLIVTSPSRSTAPTLAIVSLDTGKVVYKGIVARKENKPLENLLFYSIAR